jgi:DNA-directed RNA polymerase specialized sigma24 family protein
LHREFNWDAAEIADMLGLTKREVNKWLSSK